MVPIPASPSEDGDGGVRNGDPTIRDPNPAMPGPWTLNPAVPQQYSVTLHDGDIEDTLFVRVYRDYQKGAVGFLDERMVTNGALGQPARQPLTLPTNNWCNNALLGESMIFDVMVADQPFDTDSTKKPEYRVVTNNGSWSIRSWMVTCATPL